MQYTIKDDFPQNSKILLWSINLQSLKKAKVPVREVTRKRGNARKLICIPAVNTGTFFPEINMEAIATG